MTDNSKLVIIKLIHTLIWVFFNVVIFYLLYAVLTDTIDKWVWICLGLILLETITLIIFKRVCPVTLVARRYSGSARHNFDIYLPEWLAKYNKQIYTIIVFIILLLLAWRLAT
ncbi:MAG: hypothetical protein AAB221_02070 [Bacteroidota bacterium]